MFQVTTNHQTGYGGFASSGWEGVAIDDVTVVHRPGTAQEERLQLSNFSSDTSGQIGDPRGWLDASSGLTNEWNWTTSFGMNPSESLLESFEASMTTPPGWVIEGTWPDGWEIGQTQKHLGLWSGCVSFGSKRRCRELDNQVHQQHLHPLTTQEYSIPTNATARLSFRSWCVRKRIGTGVAWPFQPTAAKIGGGSSPTQRVPRPNFNGEHEFSTLRRGDHRWFQCSQRVRCIQP